jgi:hypothetical protein
MSEDRIAGAAAPEAGADDVTVPVPEAGPDDVSVPAPGPVAAAPAAPAPQFVEPEASAPPPEAPGTAAPVAPVAPVAPPKGRRPLDTLRTIAVGLAFFLTCLSLVVTTTDWWINQTFTDTDAFVEVTAPLVDDPDVQEALAQATATRLTEAFDLGPLGSYVVVGISRELYASDAFAQLWEGAMRAVHTVLIAVLEDESNLIDMVDGQVYINLYPFLDRILDRLSSIDLVIRDQEVEFPTLTDPTDPAASKAELEEFLGRPLPEDFGTVPVARGENLVAAQQAFAILQTSIVVLAVVTLLLAVLTVVLARRRIRMIALLGVGALASLLVARLAIAALQDAVADALTGGGSAAVIGREIVDALVASYRELTQVALLLALVAAVVATVVAWTLSRRARETGSAAEESIADGWFLGIAGLCIALAALILVGLTLVSFVIVAIAYAAWVAILVWTRRRAVATAAA